MAKVDIDPVIENVSVDERVSTKGGKYSMLVLSLVNGEEVELYLEGAYATLFRVLAQLNPSSKS